MDYHLLKTNGKWQLQREGTDQALFSADTKEKAIEALQEFMNDHEGNVAIHKMDGAFQETRSYPSPNHDRARDDQSSGLLSNTAWGVIGVVAVAATTAAAVAYHYRDRLPTDRLPLIGKG